MFYLFSALFIAAGVWGYDVAHMTTSLPSVFWVKQSVVLTNLLSILTLGVMLTTALRPAWLVQRLKGMDQLYRLHCVSGLLAAVVISVHGILLLLPAWIKHHQMPWSLDALLCLPMIGRIQLFSILLFYCVLIFFIVILWF
jgi:predicted ferric reductase